MALYLIGDVQGCDNALARLLQSIDFSPSRDSLVLLGDMVNRGPDSLAVLRRVLRLGASARCVLGNHDLHLLALDAGVRPAHRHDSLQAVLEAPDRRELLDWLRTRPLALLENVGRHQLLMVHAGVLPSWTAERALALAGEVQEVLAGPGGAAFLADMYGNQPTRWHAGLTGTERLRAIVNVLTRLRFCTADDHMEFESKEGVDAAPTGYGPWFDAPGRLTAAVTVAFGHWSTVGWLGRRDVLSLDTGCVWGGALSAVHVQVHHAGPDATVQFELLQVPCPQLLRPGQ
ncbi:MAG: symmetrical bis(5'-nucleosyl)-tetraphosphatase [Burkholderiaceae bacterium]